MAYGRFIHLTVKLLKWSWRGAEVTSVIDCHATAGVRFPAGKV